MDTFRLSNVLFDKARYDGKRFYVVTMLPGSAPDPSKEPLTDRANLAWLPVDFHNGTVEVDVAAVFGPRCPSFCERFHWLGLQDRIQSRFRGHLPASR